MGTLLTLIHKELSECKDEEEAIALFENISSAFESFLSCVSKKEEHI